MLLFALSLSLQHKIEYLFSYYMDNQTNKDSNTDNNANNSDLYFASLTLTDVKCFKGEHTIKFTNEKGEYYPWTVILGNNNTGKTTILKSLVGLTPTKRIDIIEGEDKRKSIYVPFGLYYPLMSGDFRASLSSEKKNVKKMLNKWGYKVESLSFFTHKNKEGKTLRYPEFSTLVDEHITEGVNVSNIRIIGYGVGRRLGENTEKGEKDISTIMSGLEFLDVEKWLIDIHLATFQEVSKIKAQEVFERAKNILTSDILPDVKDVRIQTEQKGNTSFDNFVEFLTDFGWVRINELGYGYQSMVAWLLDLVRQMMELYPNSANPLAEPVVVLIDEIDLHLHPEWQRKIIAHLSKYFPKAQFIVTAHSPLIVQSAENVNVVLLQKVANNISITQPAIHNFRGWTIDEILTEIMGMEDRIHSDYYIALMKDFETALDTDNYDLAQDSYQKLDKILHPSSHQRKLLRIQMSSLTPANAS